MAQQTPWEQFGSRLNDLLRTANLPPSDPWEEALGHPDPDFMNSPEWTARMSSHREIMREIFLQAKALTIQEKLDAKLFLQTNHSLQIESRAAVVDPSPSAGHTIPTVKPLKVALLTRTGPRREEARKAKPLEEEVEIAKVLLRRYLGPIEIVKHCHAQGSCIAGLDSEGRHLLFEDDIQNVFPYVNILAIVGWSGLAADLPTLYRAAKRLPVNSNIAFINYNDEVFLLPTKYLVEHCLDPQAFFNQAREQMYCHPFLQFSDAYVSQSLFDLIDAMWPGRNEYGDLPFPVNEEAPVDGPGIWWNGRWITEEEKPAFQRELMAHLNGENHQGATLREPPSD